MLVFFQFFFFLRFFLSIVSFYRYVPVATDDVIQVAKHVSDEGKQPNDRSSKDQMSVSVSLCLCLSVCLSVLAP